jgi:hypothetical protein
MDIKRLLIGIALFVGSFVVVGVGVMTPILGPLLEHPDLRAVYAGFAPAQRIFVLGCFVAAAYSLGMILDALVRFFRKN